MWRCHLVLLLALIAVNPCPAAERPNIIVILADDLGWGDLSCYPSGDAWGEEARIPTPDIDAIAAGGVQCMQAYATGMVCAPSRAGLLTGQYQSRWGYYGFEDSLAPIPRRIQLLPEILRDAGYATGMVGKWHISTETGSLPLQRGFERFFGFLGGQHDYYYASLGQPFHGVGYAADGHIFDQDQPAEGVRYLTEEFTDRAIDFMETAREAGKPFFLYLPYNAPHTPHQVPWADVEPYQEGKAEQRPAPRDLVRAMIVNLDRNVGRLDRWLRESGLEQNTIVIFSSDNGGSDGGPGQMIQHNGGLRGRKGTFYEGGIRVPLIIRWPARLPQGVKYERPTSHVDIFATALTAAGTHAQPQQQLDGVDLVPCLSGAIEAPNRMLFWTMEGPNASRWAVRDGDWKLILEDLHPETLGKKDRVVERKLQLFHLADDPAESRDLIATHPEEAKRLEDIYDDYISKCPPSLFTPEVELQHKAVLAARAKDPRLKDLKTATGSPGHWFGGGKNRRDEEGIFPALPPAEAAR